MQTKRSLIIRAGLTAGLFAVGFFYQNCSKVALSTATDLGSNGVQCLPQDAPGLAPTLKYNWTLTPNAADPLSQYNQVMAAPVVGDIDGDGIPEIIFTSFSGATANLYTSPGILRILDGRTGALKGSVSRPDLMPYGSTTPLLIDILGDGTKQIVYTTDNTTVVALNADLSVRWTFKLPAPIGGLGCMGGFAAADLDGDGHAEIIADNYVLEETAGRTPALRFQMGAASDCTTFATSLNPQAPEQLQVVSSDGVYNAHGTKLFSFASASQSYVGGFMAAADIDPNHPGQEVVITKSGKTALFDGTTGALIWETAVDPSRTCATGVGNGGPPNVGSFLNNGQLQIGVATGKYYSVYDQNGKLVWDYGSHDCSSAITGATLFDFNGDGKPEIIYGDENFLRIFDAANGNVLFQIPNPSATLMEYPVVADVDGDGHSELVVVANTIFENYSGYPTFYEGVNPTDQAAIAAVPPGVRVFGAASATAWMPTRPLWNQYAYFVSNVTDSLQATSHTPTSLANGANLFRQNLLARYKNACVAP